MEDLIGREVVSVKGRDKGTRYVVVEILDEYFLRVANGDNKTLDKPKRKNKKHIAPTEGQDRMILDRTDSRQGDEEIRTFLKSRNKEV